MTAKQSEIARDVKRALGLSSTAVFRFIVLAFIGLICWQGKNMANTLISQNPDVLANKAATEAAASAAMDAKQSASDAKSSATQALNGESKIFNALQQMRDDQQKETVMVATAVSTLTERIAGIGKQLDRVEAKQDEK